MQRRGGPRQAVARYGAASLNIRARFSIFKAGWSFGEKHMLVEAEIWSIARIGKDNAVLVRPVGGEFAVPIYIDQYQTQSILIGLGSVPMPRPLTHDLLVSILGELEVSISRVEITGLKEGTFFAQIILERSGSTHTVDSRPSDSIAIAVRLKCPIYIAESVVEEGGSEISAISGVVEDSEATASDEVSPELSALELLQQALQRAVDEEDYEEAALLRDRIKSME